MFRQAAIVDLPHDVAHAQAVLDDDKPDNDLAAQQLLARNFSAALARSGVPPKEIADACNVTEQAVSNWKRTGKIRTRFLPIIADLTKCSIRQLITGLDPSPPPAYSIAAREPPPPTPDFHDRQLVTESEWALLQDMKDALEAPSLAAKIGAVREEVEAMRRLAENMLRRRTPAPPDRHK